MSIYDQELKPMLCELANRMDNLEKMQAWQEANPAFGENVASVFGISVKWAYGQHDTGFRQINGGVESIVRERIVPLVKEAIEREEAEASDLHRRILAKMAAP